MTTPGKEANSSSTQLPEVPKETMHQEAQRWADETAVGILKKIQTGQIKPKELPTEVRRMVVQYLETDQNLSNCGMATLLGVNRNTITADLKYLQKQAEACLAPFHTEVVAKHMVVQAERLRERARRVGDTALEWKIIAETTDRLGKMGFISYKADMNLHIGDKNETHITNVSVTNSAGVTAMRTVLNGLHENTRIAILRAWRQNSTARAPRP